MNCGRKMSKVLLGLVNGCELATELVEALKGLGYETHVVYSGYDVIRDAVRLKPSAVVLHSSLEDCDILKTSVWLNRNKVTSQIPQFLISTLNEDDTFEKWKLNGAAETVCNFKARFSPDDGAEAIAQGLKKFEEANGLSPSSDGEPSSEPPSQGAIQADLVEAFESHYIKSRLLLRLLQINRNINEVDYFSKILMEQVAGLFECELISFLWKGECVTEYDLITGPVELGMFEALRRLNQGIVRESGWGGEGPTDLITWGRQFLADSGEEVDPDILAARSVKIDITFKEALRGTLTLATANPSPDFWDTELVVDFKNHLAPIFSNFIMYQDLEMNLSRDDRIFQAIGELAGISTLELESFRSFLLQSLLILLDLYSTNRGAIVMVGENQLPDETVALGESEEFFTSLTSGGESIIDRVLKEPGLYAFGREVSEEDGIEQLDEDTLENLVVAPLECTENLFGIVLLANIHPFNTGKEKKSVMTFAKLISNHIYNKTLSDEYVDKKSIEEQLTLAREIQMGLLPDGEMNNKAFDIFAKSIPAKQVGGDFFDYYPIDEEWLGVSIADISGKGIPASLLMSMTKSVFQSLFEAERHPSEILTKANNILAKQFFSDKFVTALFGLFVPNRLVLASGGHHPLIVYRTSEDRFEKIDPDGIALGIMENAEFEVAEVEFEPGDVAVFFTDGLCESSNSENEQFGYERIEQVVRAKALNGAEAIVEGLFEALEEHTAGMPAFDDTTVMVAVAKSGEMDYPADTKDESEDTEPEEGD
jgi:serine phosphatase RsbU (regulator of sigma subunit)